MRTASKPATAKRNGLALESCDVPESAVKKHRTERDRRAAFERLAAEFGPKRGARRRKTVDAVGFLIKLRRGEA